jgi:hypothetical protein
MLHQIALDAGCPFEALRERSGNCALPCPRDAHDQDDHGLLGYVLVLADHESILTWVVAEDPEAQPPHVNAPSCRDGCALDRVR